jgi:hypothetical protein
MANNYYQATMLPDSISLNPMHQAYLAMTGASLDSESDGRFYVYWEESLSEEVDEWAIDDALDEGTITQEFADFIKKNNFNDMMRHILMYNPEVTHLEISGAWTCSKMRPGEFGGATCIVSRTEHLDMNTGSASFNKETGKIEVRFNIRTFDE